MKKLFILFSGLFFYAVFFMSPTYAIDCGNPPATGSYVYQDNIKINTIIQKQIDGELKDNTAVYLKYKAEYAKIKNPTQRQKEYYQKLLFSLKAYNTRIVNAYKKNKKNYVVVDFTSYSTKPSDRFCDRQIANQSKKTRTYEVDPKVKITVTLGVGSCADELEYNPGDPYYKKRCGKITFDEWIKFGCGKESTVYRPNYMDSCVSDPKKGGRYLMSFQNGKVIYLEEGYTE